MGDNSPTYHLCQENNGGKKTEHHDDHTIQFAVSVGRDRDSKERDHRPTTTTIHLYISTYRYIYKSIKYDFPNHFFFNFNPLPIAIVSSVFLFITIRF